MELLQRERNSYHYFYIPQITKSTPDSTKPAARSDSTSAKICEISGQYRNVCLVPHAIFILIFSMLAGVVSAQDTSTSSANIQLYAGAASADITPSIEVKNWVTGEAYGVVHDPIHARALVLSDGAQKVVLLHWEIVDIGESARDTIRALVAEKLQIPAGNILVNAAHNHSAPWSPVYGANNSRGLERYPWWVTRHMTAQDDDPYFQSWKKKLLDQSIAAVVEADRNAVPVTMWLGRYDVSRFLRNRRPRPVTSGVGASGLPDAFNYNHPDWDPRVLSGDRTFGPMDRTMTVLSFRDSDSQNVATVFHLACHAVSIYPFRDDLSGDWPAAVTRNINHKLGGNNLFLQGAAGNTNPWRRDTAAVTKMAEGLTHDISVAYKYSASLMSDSLRVDRTVVGLPLTDYGQGRTGLSNLDAEIQVISLGSLAIVTLPGEPMTQLSQSIVEASPFPQTIVLGYSNGNGGHYCGMPGEKAYGGYETGERTNLGSDQAGMIMVKAAIGLLEKMYKEDE